MGIADSFDPQRPQSDTSSQARAYLGSVIIGPADVNAELRVSVREIDNSIHEAPARWMPRVSAEGGTLLPSVGDAALVEFDSKGDAWIVSWWSDDNTGAPDVGPSINTVLHGAGAPGGGLGADGDFYVDTTAHAIYGPKAAGVWGAATSLVGPTGSTGATGATGPQGVPGATGATGPAGPTGATGATGSTGAAGSNGTNGTNGTNGNTVLSGSGVPGGGTGVNGDYYVDTTAHAIYGPKTAGAWGSSTSLIGPTGATGATGSTGATGPTGSTGAAGTNGTNGTNGNTILNGTVAPVAQGVNGDFYIDTVAKLVYGPKTAGVWGSGTSYVGPTGATGATGSTGATGATGPTGPTGATGPAGAGGSYSQDIGDGVNTVFTITHGLATRDVSVVVRRTTSPYEAIWAGQRAKAPTTGTVEVTISPAPSTGQFRVSIYK